MDILSGVPFQQTDIAFLYTAFPFSSSEERRGIFIRGSADQAGRQIHGRRSAEQRTPGGAAGRGDAPASKRYSRPSRDKRPKPKGQARPYANSRPVKKGKGSFRKKKEG